MNERFEGNNTHSERAFIAMHTCEPFRPMGTRFNEAASRVDL